MTPPADIEILISTMDRDRPDFLRPLFPHALPKNVRLLVINQSQNKSLQIDHPKVRVINTKEKGLAKSRNLALKEARGAICIFTDDDVVFLQGFADKVEQAFRYFPDSSFIRICGTEKGQAHQSAKQDLSWLDILNTRSIEMCIRRADIIDRQIWFDPRFGLGGTLFEMGEEPLFLAAIKKKGLRLSHYPGQLNWHHGLSTAQKLSPQRRYFVNGALTTAIFSKKAVFWILLKMIYALKQQKLRYKEIFKALKAARKGRKTYLDNEQYNRS